MMQNVKARMDPCVYVLVFVTGRKKETNEGVVWGLKC